MFAVHQVLPMRSSLACLFCLLYPALVAAAEPSAAERGYKALTEKSYIPASYRPAAYENAWKHWDGVKEKPADYDAAYRDYYGLHAAPYSNNNLPMGLRPGTIFGIKGIAMDCMMCHGGSIFGKSYIGLGNASLDVQAVFEDMLAADGHKIKLPFTFSNVRGTSEAGSFAVYLLGYRDADLKMKKWENLGLHDDLCEDTPAWWLLKKKKTMYHTGGADARSVRSKMQFMLTQVTPQSDFPKHEAAFKDINAYLMTIEAPKYPMAIDKELAAKGEKLFRANCSECHGTYGEKWTYPNRIIPLEEIGTDPKRFEGIESRFGDVYNRSWFAKEVRGWFEDGYKVRQTNGYQAPPLDGIWATAPYLHNGSVPTLYQVLNSKERPKLYTRSFRTGEADYDSKRVGWKYTELNAPPSEKLHPHAARKIYDTSKPGRSNKGHTFGDELTDAERWAVIEYLKTL
jgi:mono/diheme cytochrome c family protein